MEPVTSPIESVRILSEIAPKLNFAAHQSAFAFLRSLQIENSGTESLNGLVVELAADPSFLKPKLWRLDRIKPGEVVSVKDRDVELNGDFLFGLTDSLSGTVSFTVRRDDQVLAEEVKKVELLAKNEWGGAGYMPELLAAFSLANDPAADRLIHEASMILRKAGKPDGIDGYKSKSRQRVWEISSAIYAAIANLGISYTLPPASFERDGQKIRLPSQILSGRVATCLDTTMLFAAVLEQAGLNPVIVLPHGHALVGVWLQPEELSTIVVEDAEILRKRIQLNELVLIETTLVTSSSVPPFSKAIETGLESIPPEKDETFLAAVDIQRARAHRIQPLGYAVETPAPAGDEEEDDVPAPAFEEAPQLPDFDAGLDDRETSRPETPAGRLERWQRKLLDLSALNPLLNHRVSKTSLGLICPDPGLLEDKLAAGARIAIQALPNAIGTTQDEELHKQRTGERISKEFAKDALDKNQVLVDLPPEELAGRAVEIYRKTQTALQEGGANTLYLAIGFLLWKQKETDTRRFRAPLILLPVILERKSARSGLSLLSHDDEPRFNTTLLEMLRKDFSIDIQGLDGALPTDQSGIDVALVWNKVRLAVKEAVGFEVVEDVVLGNFSFAKYLMWKDLVDRADDLRKSPVVKHLIDSPREAYRSSIAFVEADELDRSYAPADLLTPLQADASQMSAIATADKGKDFIIIGPPGTGKSQTISNLIAHMIGKGKTVLFVSEKTAALEVVHRRLQEIGLGRFCLQLHSNKANKADVLDQLRKTWDLATAAPLVNWTKESERLKELRDQLNQVVARLHLPRKNGLTAYAAIGVKIRDEVLASRVAFNWPSSETQDEQRLEAMREAVRKLSIQWSALGDVSSESLDLVEGGEWSPVWESQIVDAAQSLSKASQVAMAALETLLKTANLCIEGRTLGRLEAVASLAGLLLDSWQKQGAFALGGEGSERIEALGEAVGRLKNYAGLQADLSCAYDPFAWRMIDGDDIARRWQAAQLSMWPKRVFAKKAIVKEMMAKGAKSLPDPMQDAPILKKLRSEGEAIDRVDRLLAGLRAWNGHATMPEVAEALKEHGLRVRNVVRHLSDESGALVELQRRLGTLLEEGNDLLAPDAAVGRAAQAFLDAWTAFLTAVDACGTLCGQQLREALASEMDPFALIQRRCDGLIAHRSELRNWCSWRKARAEAVDLDLEPLVVATELGKIPAPELLQTFEAAYCTWWSGAVITEDETLRNFSALEHDETIRRFQELDGRFQELTAAYIAAKLCGGIPDPTDYAKKSGWGTLRHEIQKKSRHKPVRQLLQEIPDVLTTLSPCLMMSPLSVAQYLPPDQALFDLVIFDEASQITVWDAVGALARGRQVVIAGDPKQMPPTNFFARGNGEDPDGEVDTEGDLESILDEMEGASIPKRTLNLHYRSRRESLIAFSNSRYYENSLITFPAPVNPDRGIRLVRPTGFYARGEARHNEGEAKAIVAEILRRLKDPDPLRRSSSIGVVTFNAQQQKLIEDLLDSARSDDPEIEWAFSSELQTEPIFVKNLETVQGDERDTILFSVTYGPDQGDLMTMNFGPLNRSGGERRLNVALTRARSEMVVFSTLSPERIELSRTQARGVADLKHFLEYAERGSSALAAATHGSQGDFESPFEEAVAVGLARKGWILHSQVGVSAYRIDLGVVNPDFPGSYLAGVECDGAMYHSSAYARERDKIRQSVLERLGWTLLRVWSTDWWNNPGKSLESLHRELESRLESDRKQRAAKVIEEEERRAAKDAELAAKAEIVEDPVPYALAAAQVTLDSPSGALASQMPTVAYRGVDLEADGFHSDPELFYSEEYTARLAAMIDHVIEVEGPIHEDVLVRRIARHHGFLRAGTQIRNLVTGIAKSRQRTTEEDVGVFYWASSSAARLPARSEGRDEEMRNVEYICREELQAIKEALALGDDPVEVTRALGISRLTKNTRKRLCDALGLPFVVIDE